MSGFRHEFKRGYDPGLTTQPYQTWPIGQVDSSHIADWPSGVRATDTNPIGDIELAAVQVPAPGISENFMAPVNDVCSFIFLHTQPVAHVWVVADHKQKMPKVDYGIHSPPGFEGYIGTQDIEIV